MARDTREYVIYNGHLQRVRSSRPAPKPFEGMSVLDKLTSFKYLTHKMREWVHKDKRENLRATIAMEEDDEANCRRSMRDSGIIGCDELMAGLPKPSDRDDRRASITTTRTSDSESSHFSQSFLTDDTLHNEAMKEQRWCRNCCKRFQKQLSHFELYCGLDCKTAHHVRQSM